MDILEKNKGGVMHKVKDYLVLSILSYFNFPKKSIGKKIREVVEEVDLKQLSSNDNLLKNENYFRGENFFSKEMNEWSIHKIYDRTRRNSENSKSGFYAIIFKKINTYVVSYRGSETSPLKEAYKDFIETDLMIGLGKRPLQFFEGVEIFEKLVEEGIEIKNIKLTGHSLGGGIAQFVAMISYKKYKEIPYTYTWNSVGINRDGIIKIEDFFDYEEILKKCKLSEKEEIIFKEFKKSYIEFLIKELKKKKVIKEKNKSLLNKKYEFQFSLDKNFLNFISKKTNLREVLKKFSLKRRKELFYEDKILENLFFTEKIAQKIYEGIKFQELLKKNKIFQNKVINFCHSKDLVSFLFPHIGFVYKVDQNFSEKNIEKAVSMLKNLNIFSKSLQSYHFEDVFIPLLNEKGFFSKELSLNYIASGIRKLIYKESNFDREFLGNYYLKKEIAEENYNEFKIIILNALKKTKEEILYIEKIESQVKTMDCQEIKKLWIKVIEKLVSPYINVDIYDLIIFRKEYS